MSSYYDLSKPYIQYNESFDECTDITQTFEFVGTSATQYIEIKQNGIYYPDMLKQYIHSLQPSQH